ncbi:glycosyltransferase family 2 protein [Polaribacter sp. AHE13PA]|uniref:glycosyltransferase family 2 protein n=1 Tax=Polaribacter sp. AHE13PA TaxID=2745562 RepID=UPI001C4EE44E|nr:glycosyltransferase family 2 protein [Polaribacter sp. AHE13PA]QXP66978.1 glycosyltransferase family 2 protein [Polaribacter sp. AHE13PA]
MIDKKTSLTALVLTYNEEMHLKRCLESLKDICDEIVIIDSFSNDETENIAKEFGARFYQNPFVNHAVQLNWGIENGEINTDWVIRVDADEYISDELASSIKNELPTLKEDITGVRVKRLMYFFNKPLKKAGMYPIWHLKLWRHGKALCEQRWMDERMKLSNGDTTTLEGDLIDNNLNNLTWWTQKHNSYATREAIDILDKIYNFTNSDVVNANLFGSAEERRRWFKKKYLNLPLFVRPIIFWFIRYILQGGFLEGKRGFIWNALQCGWYRFLVDAKIYEAYKAAGKDKNELIKYFKDTYGYDITKIG